MIDPVAIDILRDMEIDQEKLVILDQRIRVRKREAPVLDGLHLRADKNKAALEGFVYRVIESSLFVDPEDLDSPRLCHCAAASQLLPCERDPEPEVRRAPF